MRDDLLAVGLERFSDLTPKRPPTERESSPKTNFSAPQFFFRNTLLQIKEIVSLERKSAAADDEDDQRDDNSALLPRRLVLRRSAVEVEAEAQDGSSDGVQWEEGRRIGGVF